MASDAISIFTSAFWFLFWLSALGNVDDRSDNPGVSASVGKFLPGIEYKIVAAHGKPTKPGDARVSGPSRTIGYLDNTQA